MSQERQKYTTNITALTTQNTWYAMNTVGTLLVSNNDDFDSNKWQLDANNNIQWLGSANALFHCAYSMSLSTSNAVDTYEIGLSTALDNTPYTGSIYDKDFAAINTYNTFASHKVVKLQTNDIVRVVARNVSSSGKTLTTKNLNLVLMDCCTG